MTNVDIFIDELGKLPHDNGSNLTWFVETDPINRVVKIMMRDHTRKPVKTMANFCLFDDIYAMPDPRRCAALIIEDMYYDFGEHIIDKKLLMSPDEAIEVLRSLKDWLYLCSMNGGTSIQREAIDIAIACLEEKCHE